MYRTCLMPSLAITMAGGILSPLAVAQPYELHIIPKPAFEAVSNDVAYAINDSGVVVGNFHSPTSIAYGFAYTLDSGSRLVDTYFDAAFGGSQAWCINNLGEVGGGSALPSDGCHRAILANASLPLPTTRLTLTPLDWLPGGGTAVVRGMNNFGVRVGYSNQAIACSYPYGNAGTSTRQYPCVATRWTGQQASLVPTPDGFASIATAVNANGDIVGFSMLAMADQNDFSMTRAFLTSAGVSSATRLATLGGSSARAFFISDAGVIVGFAEDEQGHLQAARWTSPSSVVSLGSLPDYLHSTVFQMTQDGSVAVGAVAPGTNASNGLTLYESEVLVYGQRAVLFAADQVFDLNSMIAPAPGVHLRNAFGVNSHRWIVGNCDYNGERRGFVLVPHGPFVTKSPSSTTVCRGATSTMSVSVLVNDSGSTTFQWRKDGVPLNTATTPSAVTPTLTISNVSVADSGSYDCVVSNSVGSTATESATLSVAPCCPADLDNGSGSGTPDSGVDINDLLFFLEHFELGC